VPRSSWTRKTPASRLLEVGEESFDAPAVGIGDPAVTMPVFSMATRQNSRVVASVEDNVVEVGSVIDPAGRNFALE
jgi:hypothetical protein